MPTNLTSWPHGLILKKVCYLFFIPPTFKKAAFFLKKEKQVSLRYSLVIIIYWRASPEVSPKAAVGMGQK